MYLDLYDLITDWGHFKDHRRHFKLAKRGDKQRTIPSCIKFSLSELKKASIRLQNNKFSLKKHFRLKALLPADDEEVNFPHENNLPEDFKSTGSVASFAPTAGHDSPFSYF